MATTGYTTAHLHELERDDGWAPIRRTLGIQSFGVNAWSAHAAGETLIPEHDEKPSGHEELYLVISGQATFTVDGEVMDAPAATVVFVSDPEASRAAVATQPGTTILSVGAAPGHVYAPRSWEVNRDVFALLDAGEPAAAKKLLLDALDDYSDQDALFYNLACAEAQLNEADAALDHLANAVRANPALAESAQHDPDLRPLRTDPRFVELIAAF